ncbi:hypothetical protein HHI36_011496 [Cryptolaemus montrouzieri]|uniref:THAP-type domain-containing protein n=1 Tax=Cryptolaemus montrouzieri TaxID=559131 RepID=A0ABD2MM95_9CUCU
MGVFVFPSDEVERKIWIALLRREDKQPSRYSLVCSCHFIDKDRNNGPTLFEHNKTKRFSDLSSASGPKAKKSNIQILEDELSMPSTSHASSHLHAELRISPIPCWERGNEEEEDDPSYSEDTPAIDFSATTEAENYSLKEENEKLSEKLEKLSISFSYAHIQGNDAHILLYTGIPTEEIFMKLFNLIDS